MSAFRELVSGVRDWRRWAWLGWNDVRLLNRRSLLGMWWPTISIGIFVFGVGHLFSELLGRPLEIYLPHVAIGWLVWQFVQGGTIQGAGVFISSRVILQEAVLPPNTVILRILVRLTIQLLLGAAVPVLVFIYLGRPAPWMALACLVGLGLNVLIMHGAMLLLGTVCARHRDLQHLVEAAMRLVFFMTPILWLPDPERNGRSLLIDYNPFYYMIEGIRGPVLSGQVSLFHFAVLAGMAITINLLGFAIFASFRKKLIYWL